MAQELPTFQSVKQAQAVLAGHAVRTPLLESGELNARVGGRVLLKAETLQRTGSFKFRGAYNRIARLQREAPGTPVVACSSGNHAQGVAAAAALHGLAATIVMPSDAPAGKRRRTEAHGARIVTYDRTRDDREALAADIAARGGAVDIPPYDDPLVIAGQGTVGMEIAEDLAAMGVVADALIVPCGGGGLTAGVSLALGALTPETRLFTAEPDGFDDHARSFATGTRQRNERLAGSICDALLAPMPGALTFAINRGRVTAGLSVSDGEAMAAMAAAFDALKLVVEPGGAVALAAVLSGKLDATGKTVVVVLSGGNVDPEIFAQALRAADGGGAT